ncbi:MAG: hypothetical protein I3273_02775 [Candidatus Moeniiplasma glomeromycotorum]|nr:hypothetical protein [Candidatus Moeniiplasma glomeromycotorum]MCE8167620.1 hypothetical protein [Candidatus Moeniiplasma glomeromycotorum]MCE8169029.1 hypothetical protein [Candidatus Moeniiplasma glomeromycotorum]
MTGKKITGRTKQLSLKATPEFHQKLKESATKEKCLMIEVLEKAVAVWEIQKQKDLVKKITKENSVPQVSLSHKKKRQINDDTEELNASFKKIKIGK